ncbi:hypothetical protein ABFS83_11G083000 [Erythranthe nasuta]
MNAAVHILVLNELDYDVDVMREQLKKYLSSITDEQKKMFDDIMEAVTSDRDGLFCLYGHGGTRKIFIWKTLLTTIRSKGEITINFAFSGIASLLVPDGIIVHLRFGLPIIVNESSTCNVKQHSPQTKFLSKTKLIIWDEAYMMHKYCFNALDQTTKSILDSEMPFSSSPPSSSSPEFGIRGEIREEEDKEVKLPKYRCQTAAALALTHRPNTTRESHAPSLPLASVAASSPDYTNWFPWQFASISKVRLTLEEVILDPDLIKLVLKASRQDIVQATINSSPLWRQYKVMKLNKNMRLLSSSISANADELRSGSLLGLIEFVYPNLVRKLITPEYFEGTAILAPTNESVVFVNDHFPSIITREQNVYLSADSMCKEDLLSDVNSEIYCNEFLNTISCSGIPSHKLTLKRGVPVMLIKNIDLVINMGKHILNCMMLYSKHIGAMVFIPQMILRQQFPLMISFGMTINKSQGHTFSRLNVALSRVKSKWHKDSHQLGIWQNDKHYK